MVHLHIDDATPEDIEHEAQVHEPLAEVLRELAEASVRTEVDEETIASAVAELRNIRDRLRTEQMTGAYGIRHSRHGLTRPWGNAVVGLRNPIAPPLEVECYPSGKAVADFTLGAVYEGPTGLVHGGVSALLMDQLLGEAAGAGGKPGMTATLTVKYRRPTPLGPLHGEAMITRATEYKTWVSGHIANAEGICVEAEGLFVLPRWARELAAERTPNRFD